MAAIKKIEERTIQFIEAYARLKRAEKMVTHSELAKIIGAGSKATITEILNKRQNIQPEQWKKFRDYFKIGTDYSVQDDSIADMTVQDGNVAYLIEIKTASGKPLRIIPEGKTEIALLNAFLEERDRVIETLKEEKQARIEELIKEKENLNSIIKGYLEGILSNSKEIADDISALTTENQSAHRALMDSVDVASGQPIGTTRGAAGIVEIASEQERVGKGKKVQAGVGKPGK